MGWWTVEKTEDLVGDEPLQHLEDAVEAIMASYKAGWGRTPTKAEWSRLLYSVLRAYADDGVASDGAVTKASIE